MACAVVGGELQSSVEMALRSHRGDEGWIPRVCLAAALISHLRRNFSSPPTDPPSSHLSQIRRATSRPPPHISTKRRRSAPTAQPALAAAPPSVLSLRRQPPIPSAPSFSTLSLQPSRSTAPPSSAPSPLPLFLPKHRLLHRGLLFWSDFEVEFGFGDMGEVENKLKDYEIKTEGEAEILMLKSNAVFFNPVQVHNRDMSIAVLRTFVAKRKEEHEALMNKRNKPHQKANQSEPSVLNGESASTSQHDEMDVVHEKELNQAADEMEDLSKEAAKTPSWKVTRELKPPTVLEALAASGLRSLRYAREVNGLGKVVALDNDKASVEACKRNIKFNGASAISKIEAHLADARVYMLTHPKEFDVVDLDPYGSPSIFLDSAVQAVADGGLLMCTATDMAVLCGTNGEVCYSKYGSYPIKGKYCHEMALRILLASIESHANRYKRYIVPVLSVFMDFYVRVFVRVFTSASEIKNTPLKLSYVYQCASCDSFHLQCLGRTITKNNNVKYAPGIGPVVPQECSDCGKKFNVGGPIWSAPIHDQDWVLSTLTDVRSMKDRYPAYDKITSVLTTVSEELHDIPLFFSLHSISGTVKCTSPSAVMFRSAVLNAGYRISSTHVNPLGLKSDAPWNVIWDIMRCWVKNHPIKEQPRDSPGTAILSKSPKLEANFSRAVAALSKAQAKKVKRFLPNPERHWGPKVRAGRKITSKHISLLGPEAINGTVNGAISHEDGSGAVPDKPAQKTEVIVTDEENEPSTKRQKTGDDELASEP